MNNNGSIYPVAMFIPFFNLMRDGAMKDFLLIVFPGGLTVFILIVLIGALWMHYQKDKYGGVFR